ncbi:hypothetical protein ACIA8K_12535 [Catenuloplanes sp. NPDC051500]|uniref:hypothetical protein n=1 Tax=Catenuloplanes sp. NPDC051500 TaxID=3363959 RepID=UPI003799E656
MGFNVVDASSFNGGGVFKPGNHMADKALLIEPKRIDRDRPNTYQGVTKNRDEVTANITVFKTEESLSTGKPSEVLDGARVVHGMLTDYLDKVLAGGPDQAVVVILTKVPTKGGSGYAFRPATPEVTKQVIAYGVQREADIAKAVADAPAF